jgi:hypothetical protein
MTPFMRTLRNFVERWLGSFDQGPEAPEEVRDIIVEFANMNPEATRREWVEFSERQAAEAYRVGWLRGYNFQEEEWSQPGRSPDDWALVHWGPGWAKNAPSVLDPEGRVRDATAALMESLKKGEAG